MTRFVKILAALLLAALPLAAQTSTTSNAARRFARYNTLPATCGRGDVAYLLSDSTFYQCATTNTWTALGAGGSGNLSADGTGWPVTGNVAFTGNVMITKGTATVATDCDAAGEAGRIFVDTDATTGRQFYLCEGAAGWKLQGDGGAASLPVADGTSLVEGNIDATKEVRIEADGITTGTIRVWTAPNADTTLPVFTQIATFAGMTGAHTYTLPDADRTLLDTTLAASTYAPLASPSFTGTVTIPTPFTLGAVSVLPTGTELNFVDGVTSAIQGQIDAKAPLAAPTFTNSVDLGTLALMPRNDTLTATDCDAAGEYGRLQIDTNATSGQRIYVCESTGWVLQGDGGGAGTTLPVVDTTSIAEGSADATKEVRFEVDGLTTGTVRVVTIPNADTTLPIFTQGITFNGPTAARTFTLPDADNTLATLGTNVFTGAQSGTVSSTAQVAYFVNNTSTTGTNVAALRGSVSNAAATGGKGIWASSVAGYAGYFETTGASAKPVVYIGPSATHTGPADSITTTTGSEWRRFQVTELITLSTGGLTTDSSADLLPANSVIESVVCRVTTTITTSTNWAVGDATTAARFSSANATLTAGTTSVGLNHQQGSVSTDATGRVQTAAAKLRITVTGANPGAGAVRCTSFGSQFVVPSS